VDDFEKYPRAGLKKFWLKIAKIWLFVNMGKNGEKWLKSGLGGL
jgi:hypothetical protein